MVLWERARRSPALSTHVRIGIRGIMDIPSPTTCVEGIIENACPATGAEGIIEIPSPAGAMEAPAAASLMRE